METPPAVVVVVDKNGIARVRMPIPHIDGGVCYHWDRHHERGKAGMVVGITQESKDYIETVFHLKGLRDRILKEPIHTHTNFCFRFFVPSLDYDTAGGLNAACEIIAKSGIVTEQKNILPQVRPPVYSPADPRLIIEFPTRNSVG